MNFINGKSRKRIRRPSFQGSDLPLDDAISQAFEALKNKKIGVVASCHSSLEEQFLIKRLVEETGCQGVYSRTLWRGRWDFTFSGSYPQLTRSFGCRIDQSLSFRSPERFKSNHLADGRR